MYTQPDSLKLTTPLGDDALLLERFEGREAISEPYRFRLALLAEEGTDVPFEKILGAEVSVSLARPDGPARSFHGIIHRFAEAEQVAGPRGEPTFTRYEAEVVPRLWLLSRRVQSRVFASKTIPEILKEVLAGLDVVNQIQGRFWPREFCAQYRESDLAFVSRLMEEEGIFYFFRHSPDGHQMVLANTPQAHPEVARPDRVIYEKVAGGTRADERVVAWKKTQEIRSGRFTLRDYSFSMPDKDLEVSRAIQETADAGAVRHSLQAGGNAGLEIYDYPGRYAQRFDEVEPGGQDRPQVLPRIFDDGLRTVGIRMQEEAAAGLVVDGESGCRQFAAGHAFTLERHRNADGPYVLTAVEHTASVEGAYTRGEPATLTYRNTFRAIPASIPFRPARITPRPKVGGPQTGVVVGPSADDPIFCDKFGRIKVQFHWDRVGSKDADSSCWIRVSQPWAGSNWGAITLPRVGQEVVVGFLEGDPDRPMILGSVYNAAQMPPFPLPANKTQSGIKTDSHRSSDPEAFSGLGFEDADGGEHVHLHSQRHMTHSTENNLYVNAGNAHHQHVGSYSVRQVGGLPLISHSETIGGRGGGPAGRGAGDPSQRKAGPFIWNPVIMGSWAEDLDMVLGWRRCNTLGLYSTTTLGQTNATTINPLALIEKVVPIPGGATGPQALLTGLTAAFQSATIGVAIGGTCAIQWGPKVDIRRGSTAVEVAPSNNQIYSAAAKIFGGIYCLLALGDVLLPMVHAVNTDETASISFLAEAITITELALALWVNFEVQIDQAAATLASAQAFEASMNAAIVRTFGPGNVATIADAVRAATAAAAAAATSATGAKLSASQSAYTARKQAQMGANVTSQVLQAQADIGGIHNQILVAMAGAAEQVDTSGMIGKKADSLYSIESPRIILSSVLGLDPSDPSLISIQALGNEEYPGTVFIEGTNYVTLVGGDEASIILSTEGEVKGSITVDCGEAGTITLQSGIEEEPNSLTMSPEGIEIESTLKIEAGVDDASLTLTPESIRSTVAESGITISAEGIMLSVAESSISITAEGIVLTSGPSSMEITAEGVTINGLAVAVTGDESVDITGPEVITL